MAKRCVVCLCQDEQGNILYGKDAKTGKYSVPAGKLKVNENALAGAIREWKEETGTEVKSAKLLKIGESSAGIELFLVEIREYEGTLDPSQDPDKEFECLEFLDPNAILEELKVPLKDDIALKYWVDN